MSVSGMAWDYGIESRWFRTVEPTELPCGVAYLNRVLRTANGDQENEEIEGWAWAAVLDCEAYMPQGCPRRAVMPQTWQLVLSGFPSSGRIVLPVAPLIGVTSLAYYDESDEAQELALSPNEFVVIPNGTRTPAEIQPLSGESFPTTADRPDAVTVTFEAGYTDADSPALKQVIAGIGLFVGEMYRQRTLSVVGTTLVPNALKLERFWGGPL